MRLVAALAALVLVCGCGRGDEPESAARDQAVRPWILIVTLDTTRADAIGPEAKNVETPAFNALAARGLRFRQAYATAPETLPSHSSMMTGLYPGGHGVHENARYLPDAHPVLAERLKQRGYRTAAFVSSFVLSRRFGIARGFDTYNDEQPDGQSERTSAATTDLAIAHLQTASSEQPLLMWVHYFDPHTPYAPAEPFRTQYADAPYRGEIAAMDAQLGRLVEAFEQKAEGPAAIVIASDHGEGLGDHGELQHGNLVYQSTMHVPLVLVGPGIEAGVTDTPVSTRRIFHTVLDWAGLDDEGSLRAADAAPEVVLGEAMKPFLQYGWQPQTMGVEGSRKAIYAGRLELYDLAADPGETKDLSAGASLSPSLRSALEDYPVPSATAQSPATLSADERRRLASLGYISAGAAPTVRKDAPRPVDMAPLFPVLEQASALFVAGQYKQAVPLLQEILAADPHNLDAALRLATAYSSLGQNQRAEQAFDRAAAIAPGSPDVRTYRALHYARGPQWGRAAPLLEQIVAESPERLPALEGLAIVRQRQGRIEDAVALRQKIYALRTPSAAELAQLGQLAMSVRQTATAIDAFEQARASQGDAFRNDLELGVLYLDARRLEDARAALDRVPPSHPDYPMALFKRAQVSVLLKEADARARIDLARRHANATTSELIARERLFEQLRRP